MSLSRQSSLQEKPEKAFIGQGDQGEVLLIDFHSTEQQEPTTDSETSDVGTPKEGQLQFKRPAQEATPHSEGTIELTGQVKPLPTSKPGGESEEHTHRTHEEEITAIYLEGGSQPHQCSDDACDFPTSVPIVPTFSGPSKETEEYKRFHAKFDQLIEKLADACVAESLANKLRKEELITHYCWEKGCLQSVPNTDRIRPLINAVMSRVEMDPANYGKFISILKEISGLQSIIDLLEGPKFGVQESGEEVHKDPNSWLVSSTPSYTRDLDLHDYTYKSEVIEACKAEVQKHPSALGLIVLFACSVAAHSLNLPPVPGVVKGIDKMRDTFRYLGYAVLKLPINLPSSHFRAAIKAIASAQVSFPESYHRIFVYFTGHGGNDSIYTRDGNVKLEEITMPLSPNKAPHLELMTKIFIFDTCSNMSSSRSIFRNSIHVFPALPGYAAFTENDNCGLLTRHLSHALCTSQRSFGDIIIDVTAEMWKEIASNRQRRRQVPLDTQPLLYQTLKTHVSLMEERQKAMTPSMKIKQVCPTSVSVKVSLSPSSAQFKFQHLSLYHRREGTEQWTLVSGNAVVGETICISDLSPEQRYSVKVVASYPDGEDISQELECDLPKEVTPIVHLQQNYHHVDSIQFEVLHPANKELYQMQRLSVEEANENKPVQQTEREDRTIVQIRELEPGVQYSLKATAHYPNNQSVSITKTFEIPKQVRPEIEEVGEHYKPNSIAVSVSAPPLHLRNQYHLQNLSVQVWQENEEEPHPQTVPVDSSGGDVTINKLSPSTPYLAKAIATYPSTKVSSDTIRIETSSYPCCKYVRILLCLVLALLLIGSIVALSVFLIHFKPGHVPAVTKLGIQGDTIVVSDFNSFDLASVTITECPEEGDDPQSPMVSLVKKRDIITYETNDTAFINRTTLLYPVRVNLLEDEYGIYLLRESFVAVNICLSSSWESSVTVLAFLFNNSDNYQKYLANETDGIHSSLYYSPLQVGSSSQPICTWVNYSVAAPAYYYLALGEYTLGNLTYSTNLYLHEVYLKFTDYEDSKRYCSSVTESQPCSFKLLANLEQEEYTLLAYICFQDEPDSPSTHVCVTFNTNPIFVIIPAVLGAFSAVILIVLIVLSVFSCIKCISTSTHSQTQYRTII